MTATKKQMCAKTAMALEEAKAIRAKQYEHKDKRILAMVADGVPKSHIEAALRVSDRYINKVLARAAVKS